MNVTSLPGLFRDNPIIHKDALLLLRRKRTVFAWLLAAAAVVVIGAIAVASESHNLRLYGTLDTAGEELFLAMLGTALVGVGLLVPAIASAAIAGEREHGTLPLLVVSGLSPARIVAGKIAAVVIVSLPFLALPLPGLLLGTVYLGVEIPHVGLTIAALLANVVAFAATGVFASAATNRARIAAPAALLCAGVPAVLCAIPTFATGAMGVDGVDVPLRLLAGSIVAATVVTIASSYGAWSALAPRLAPRFRWASVTLVVAAFIAPLLVGALGLFDSGRVREPQGVMMVFAVLVTAGAVFLFSAGVGRDQRAPVPFVAVPLAALVGGLGLAGMVLLGVHDTGTSHATSTRETWQIATLITQVLAGASLAAFAGRFVKSTGVAAVLAALVIIGALIVPAVLDEFTTGTPPLAFLNFTYVREAGLAPLFWVVVAGLALALARRQRTRLKR